eukprot:gb/GFBE01013717.1/.p1 GENE.gb/GFBE01013717.1/~~gb/GFBE01013717.1/.p1  ORF type:complete len:105 (+),score=13.93 gb/GFBE01013717.1/:1-315(+)
MEVVRILSLSTSATASTTVSFTSSDSSSRPEVTRMVADAGRQDSDSEGPPMDRRDDDAHLLSRREGRLRSLTRRERLLSELESLREEVEEPASHCEAVQGYAPC